MAPISTATDALGHTRAPLVASAEAAIPMCPRTVQIAS